VSGRFDPAISAISFDQEQHNAWKKTEQEKSYQVYKFFSLVRFHRCGSLCKSSAIVDDVRRANFFVILSYLKHFMVFLMTSNSPLCITARSVNLRIDCYISPKIGFQKLLGIVDIRVFPPQNTNPLGQPFISGVSPSSPGDLILAHMQQTIHPANQIFNP